MIEAIAAERRASNRAQNMIFSKFGARTVSAVLPNTGSLEFDFSDKSALEVL
ncbi:MAG: hypothetical protein M3R14_09305 [Acidobacteriota bacterium]|nr:hypothetical protein [Acidobacteriota bacterium]